MNATIIYTVLSLANLIGYTVAVGFLPAHAPIHFDAAMTADVLGSPWVFLALPGAAALIAGGLWATFFQKKNRAVTMGLLVALGIALATVGWAFFALAASGAQIGERAEFPVCLVTVFPLSLCAVWLGCFMTNADPERVFGLRPSAFGGKGAAGKIGRLGGALFSGAGLLSALAAATLGIYAPPSLRFLPAVVLGASVLLAAAIPVLYAYVLSRKNSVR